MSRLGHRQRDSHWRPHLLAAALLAVTGLLLAACSGTGNGGGAVRSAGPVHITFWSALRGSQQVVDAFNRTHHDVHVDYQQIPGGTNGGYAKLSNAARAGNAPDVATIEYPELPGFAIDGVARNLDSLLTPSVRRSFQSQALALTTFAGHTYAVPLDIEPMVFYYRTDVFAKYGLRVPTTWPQFESAAKTLKQRDPSARIASFFSNGWGLLAGLAWQAGGQWFDTSGTAWRVHMDDPATARVATYWQRLVSQGLVRTEAAGSQQWQSDMQSGAVVGYLDGAWAAGALMASNPTGKGHWAIAPMPQWDPAHPLDGTGGGSTFAVTKDSHHPSQAMEFIDWMTTSPQALRARLSSGTSSAYPADPSLVPVARAAMDTTYFGGQDIYGLFQRSAATVSSQWTWGPRMLSTLNSLQNSLAPAVAGSGTIGSALRDAQRQTLPDLTSIGLSVTTH